jgi:hypothetical protein
MIDNVNQLVESGRCLLREHPGLTEAEFRNRMLERFRARDQGLQSDTANMTVVPDAGSGSGLFAIVLLPWVAFRWLGWRGRLARHRADMEEVVHVLRREGHFASGPA